MGISRVAGPSKAGSTHDGRVGHDSVTYDCDDLEEIRMHGIEVQWDDGSREWIDPKFWKFSGGWTR